MPIRGEPRDVVQDPKASAKDIMLAAKHLAASTIEADQVALRKGLDDPAVLAQLDPAASYKGRRDDLRIAGVMDNLYKNNSAPAQATITALVNSRDFVAHPHRVDLLIRASHICRPPDKAVVAFWDKNSEPTSIHAEIVIRAIAKNATEPATALLEKRLADRRFDMPRRVEWCHSYILENRTNPEIIKLGQRLVKAKLEPELKNAAAESFFDYRPEEWYPPHGVIDPDPWLKSTREARVLARELAKTVRDELKPGLELEGAIATTLAQFDALDKDNKEGSNSGNPPRK